MKRYFIAFLTLIFMNFEIKAMDTLEPHDTGSQINRKRKNCSTKSGIRKRTDMKQDIDKIQQTIQDAEFALVVDLHPNINKIIQDLAPLFKEDESLKVALKEDNGKAQSLYAQALWMMDKKIDAAPWFFKAAEYQNEDALQEISITSSQALTLLNEGKHKEALDQYIKDLKELLHTYRSDLNLT
ncbi:MAG: hypothetical protein JSS34_06140 [Proteobacteria bacterium]|nr:hypothetical protein [Pseudomonadota bacterium]